MRIFSICAVLLFTIIACNAVDNLTKFEMEFSESTTIPANVPINIPISINSPDISTNSESTFQVNDTRKDLIEEIQLRSLVIVLDNPTDSDLSFIKEVEVFINAEGLDEIKIASKFDVPDTVGMSLELDVDSHDLKEYIKKDAFSIRVNGVFDKVVTRNHEVTIHSKFFVDAKILGI